MRLAALLLLLSSSTALADRRELYLELEGGLGVQFLNDASTASSSAVGLGGAAQLHVFYGLTNSLHVGGYARGFLSPDVAFRAVTPTLTDGSRPTGTLYENAFGAGAGALVRWRFDTGYPLAPFAQLELGFAWARFEKLQLIPEGKSFGIDLPAVDLLAPDGRLVVGLEYRLADRFLIGLHLGGRRALNRVSQWQLDAALAAGIIF